MQDQLERSVVRPVHVVEQQRDRPLASQQLEQRAQRAVIAKALARVRRCLHARSGRGQHGREIRPERLDPP